MQTDIKKNPPLCAPEECTGCAACAAVCPQACIAMFSDPEGFLAPTIDMDHCSQCGCCTRTCPIIAKNTFTATNSAIPHTGGFPYVYASWHLDAAVRKNSSSGGVFSALAETVLVHGGTVIGAAYDKHLAVRHIVVNSPDELPTLRGSKYVQSEISPAVFHSIKQLLDADRHVFFTGTPCQVAGLRAFLKHKYANLLACDFLCHGVPSPAFFKKYITESSMKDDIIANVLFRDKCTGWTSFSVSQHTVSGKTLIRNMHDDPYMEAFLRNYSLRRCCYFCKFSGQRREGDITIADFWEVSNRHPEYDRDDKGTSLVLINTTSGAKWFDASRHFLFVGLSDIETAMVGNSTLRGSISTVPPERATFYRDAFALPFHTLKHNYRLFPRPIWLRVFRNGRVMLGALRQAIKKRLNKQKRLHSL
jgi:NAD-dependent dihydropyrimidine dehydrogenase PreA subunit